MKHPERISKLKPYINKYNWEGIDFPAGPKEWKKFERNNKTIALNILFIPHNTKTIRVAYRSEHNNKRKKQVILLMITDGKKWHFLPITNLSALLQGNSSSHEGDFIYTALIHTLRKINLKNMNKYAIITIAVI